MEDYYALIEDLDHGCGDPECCGEPCPLFAVSVYAPISDETDDIKRLYRNFPSGGWGACNRLARRLRKIKLETFWKRYASRGTL